MFPNSPLHQLDSTSSLRRWLPWAALAAGGYAAWCAWKDLGAISLRGKVVLITGGSRGLGLVMARQLVAEGADVAILSRDREELDRAFDELARSDARVLAMTCDITVREQAEAAVAEVLKRRGRIDVLINNAGVITVGPVETMTMADYELAMRTHFWGPLYFIRAVLPSMRRQGGGRIVNITSIGGKVSAPHLVPYNASKFALVGLSEGLRAELAKDGIAVTTVAPGLMRTGSPLRAWFKGRHRSEFAWFSISGALPLLSMSADSAARRILDACKRGEAEVVLSLPAKLAVLLHDLFPGLTADVLGVVNRLLPGPGGIGTDWAEGQDSTSAVSPSWVTTLSDQAADDNNERVPGPHPTPPQQLAQRAHSPELVRTM